MLFLTHTFYYYQSGFLLAMKTLQHKLPILKMEFNGVVVYNEADVLSKLRVIEYSEFFDNGPGNINNFITYITYDQREISVQTANYSLYTTSFIIVLLMVSV